MAQTVKPVPDDRPTVSPYLVVEDASGVLDFVEQAFRGTVIEKHLEPEGRVVHAEIRIGDSVVMVGESNDEWSGFKTMIHLYVPDVDDAYARAIAAGARSVRKPETMDYGDRSGGVEDPSGTQWWIATRVAERPTAGE